MDFPLAGRFVALSLFHLCSAAPSCGSAVAIGYQEAGRWRERGVRKENREWKHKTYSRFNVILLG